MKNEIQNKSVQATTQKSTPTQFEVNPKLEFGVIQITAIFGFILITVVGIIVRLWWTKRERLVKASDELHAAFAPALAQLYLAKHHTPFDVSSEPNVEKFLSDSLPDQATVIERFSIYVPKSKRPEYHKAWNEYHCEVEYGFDTTCHRTDIGDPYAVYENLIHAILAFGIHHAKD